METIEKKVLDQVQILENEFSSSQEVKRFQKTSDEFDSLVEKGITKKRGYNLLSATDAHIKNTVWFNAKS